MKNERNRTASTFFQFDGDFYTYTGKIFDLILVSVWWLIGCLPIVTAGASFAALHAAVTKSVRRDIGSVTKQFWQTYRRNLLPSLPLSLIYGGGIFLLLLNIGIVRAKVPGLPGLFLLVLYALATAFAVLCACYGFPALSVFDMPTGWLVKLSCYLVVRHLPLSLLILALFTAAYLALLSFPAAVVLIPGVAASVVSMLLDPVLEKHMPSEKKGA